MLKSALGGAGVTVSDSVTVCESDPLIAVRTIGYVPDDTVEAAATVIEAGVPAVSAKDEGVSTTPDGAPVAVTWIVPAKPLMAAADRPTEPLAPWTIESAGGASASEKSGVAALVMVNTRAMECVSVPEVPVKTMLYVPAVAFVATVRLMACGVKVESNKLEGVSETPAGMPLATTLI